MGITLKLNEEGKLAKASPLSTGCWKKTSLTDIYILISPFKHTFKLIFLTPCILGQKYEIHITTIYYLYSCIYVFCYPSFHDQWVSIIFIVTESPSDIKKSKYIFSFKSWNFLLIKSILTSRIWGSNCGNYAWTFNIVR